VKTKLFLLLFLAGSILSNLLFAQFQQQGPKLVGTGTIGNPINQGNSVSISSDGNTAIVGGWGDNSRLGAVWIFIRNGNAWTQQGQKLVGTGAIGDYVYQGCSVGISSDGNTAIVGGTEDNYGTGAVWIFTRSNGIWKQQGQKMVGTGATDQASQGNSVAISSDGNTAIVGGYEDNNFTGAFWIFVRSGDVWIQQGPKLVGTNGVGVYVYQGWSVAISPDGNTVIEGGQGDNNNIGAAWIFTRSVGVWIQQGAKLVGTGGFGININQGSSVAISSDGTALIGGSGDNQRNRCSVGFHSYWECLDSTGFKTSGYRYC
jgi:hypothetical protein